MILKQNTLNGVKLEDLKYSELFQLLGKLELSVVDPLFLCRPSKKEIIKHIKRLRQVLDYTITPDGEYLDMSNLTNKELLKELKNDKKI